MKPLPPTETLASPQISCSQCNLAELCLPVGLSEEELAAIDALVHKRRRIGKHQALFEARAAFESIYAVRVGGFKTVLTLPDGREQVTGFYMSGELLGMDGIGTGLHAVSAIALEDSEVCLIEYRRLNELAKEIPALMSQFHKVLSCQLVRDQGIMTLLGTMRAEERVAAFLLNLSQRYAARGFSAQRFRLRMTREEIGSYLGLKLETVSRVLSQFHDHGWIHIHRRDVEIRQPAALQALLERRPLTPVTSANPYAATTANTA